MKQPHKSRAMTMMLLYVTFAIQSFTSALGQEKTKLSVLDTSDSSKIAASTYTTLTEREGKGLQLPTPLPRHPRVMLTEKELRMTQSFKSISFFLAIVTLILSASGLFAQISLNIDKRSKEIGMHKVLGASMLQIIGVVKQRFVHILLIAFVVGSIFGYLFTSKFIFQFIFKYHPDAEPTPYIGTFLTVVICCCIIIGSKVYRGATANPIERLHAD